MEILIYLAAGSAAGLLAGMFGVGGGLIVVPVLASVFTWQGLVPEFTMQVALGTSLLTIVATSISSTRSHHARGAVRWDLFLRLAPGIVLGTWIGARIADVAHTDHLRIGFAVAECLLALYMWPRVKKDVQGEGLPGTAGLSSVAVAIGSLSSLGGIGGGSLTVPYLTYCRVVMTQAVGTSAACGLPIAISGSLAYVVWGWSEAGLPDYSLGYVYLPAALGIMTASVLVAPLGARMAHSLSEQALRKCFSILLGVFGLKLLLF